jgi:hypothetical protein
MSAYHMYIIRSFLIILGLFLLLVYIAVKIYKDNQVIPEDLIIEELDEEAENEEANNEVDEVYLPGCCGHLIGPC